MRQYKANVRLEMMPKNANVIIRAPLELAGATVRVNNGDVGQLWPDGLLTRSSFFAMFARALPVSNHAVTRLALPAGSYDLRIEKNGYGPIEMTFSHDRSGTTEVSVDAAFVKRPSP